MLTKNDLIAIKNLITSSLKPLGDKIGSLDSKVGSLESKVGSLESKVGGLDSKVVNLSDKITNMEITNNKNHREIIAKMEKMDKFLDKELMVTSRKVKSFEEYYPLPVVN